jgi:hypothetical protein
MCVNVRIKNKTEDYIFYVGAKFDRTIFPDDELAVPLKDLGDSVFMQHVLLSFDRTKNPTPWKTYGLGEGIMGYSFDPICKKSQFSFVMSPAADGPQETPAPTFEVTGDVNGVGRDSWDTGIELILYGSDGNEITLAITE